MKEERKVEVKEQPNKVFEQPKNSKQEIPGETKQDQLLPVLARIRKRVTQIKEDSSAKTVKIPRGSKFIHVTESPKMHIVGLEPVLSNKDYGTITYGVYADDGKGNKVIKKQYATVDEKKRLVNAAPVLEKTVVEYFEFRKPGYMEIHKEEE